MKRLIRVVLISVFVVALLCGGALIIGRAQPALTLIPELKPCAPTLCYLNISLDKTVWDQGLTDLRQNPKFKSSGFANVFEYANPDYLVAFTSARVEDNPALVFDEVQLSFPNLPFQLGKVVGLLGAPCFLRPNADGLDLQYPHLLLHVPSKNLSLAPTSPVNYLDMQSYSGESCGTIASQSKIKVYPWRGFRKYP